MIDPLADRLLDELRASAGRRKRLLAVECDDALGEAAPQLQSDPSRRRRLRELLSNLRESGHIEWSVALDRTVRPELPNFVTLIGDDGADDTATATPAKVPWRPELEWAYELRLTPSENDVLATLNTYRRDRDPHAKEIPHRERSLLLFGDEKRIDRLVRSRLFGLGLLTLDLLDAYWAAPPIAWKATGETGPVVVSENAASWHTLVAVLGGTVRAVAYGGGGAFSLSVASLADIGEIGRVLYIGDLDAEGVAIPQRAATAAAIAGVPVPEPHAGMWAMLVELAAAHGQPATPVPAEVAGELCTWFADADLAKGVQRLLEAGVRVPQEALTAERLATP